MPAIQKDVAAQFGKWSLVKNAGGDAVEYIGRFTDENHALGAATHLYKSGIMNRMRRGNQIPTLQQLREGDGHHYVIHLKREWPSDLSGDHLEQFKAFADSHAIPITEETVPKPKQKKEIRAHSKPRAQSSWAFRPAPAGIVEKVIGHLNWESVEPGIVTVTYDPAIAFQAALYLKSHRYMDEHAFRRLNDEIAAVAGSGEQAEFRIAVPPEKFAQFSHQFPEAGIQKPKLEQKLVELIHAMSAPKAEEDVAPGASFRRRWDRNKPRQKALGLE